VCRLTQLVLYNGYKVVVVVVVVAAAAAVNGLTVVALSWQFCCGWYTVTVVVTGCVVWCLLDAG